MRKLMSILALAAMTFGFIALVAPGTVQAVPDGQQCQVTCQAQDCGPCYLKNLCGCCTKRFNPACVWKRPNAPGDPEDPERSIQPVIIRPR